MTGLRTLPLIEVNSFVAKGLGSGQFLVEAPSSAAAAERMRTLIDKELARLLGPDAPAEFWAAHDGMVEAETSTEGYPPKFPPFEAFWARWLKGPTSLGATKSLIDLSSLLMLAGAHSQGEMQWTGTASFVLLRRLAQAEPTCDGQLNLAFVVSLGYSFIASDPAEEAVVAEFERAEDLCGEDISPGIYLGNYLLDSYLLNRDWQTSQAAFDRVVTHFEGLVRRFPQSWLPRLALASTYLLDAEARVAESVPRGPFTARAEFTKALAYFDSAVRATGDLAARFGRARALLGLGRTSESLADVESLVSAGWSGARIIGLGVTLLEKDKRFSEAASWSLRAAAEPVKPDETAGLSGALYEGLS